MTKPDLLEDPLDFSLVLGGPVFQFFRRSHLAGEGLELLYRRLLILTAITWLPLLLLATLGSSAGDTGLHSFFHDIEVHVRFLIALPILVAAEVVVHQRIRLVAHRFVERRIVLSEDVPRFHRAVESATKLRNSFAVEIGLVLVTYTLGLWVWHARIGLNSPTWFAMPGGPWRLTSAGYWYVFISLPIVQFFLLRWYLRLFIWFRFLWHVSKLNLRLISSHPDRCAGLAFLGKSAFAFGPVLSAQGALAAGLIASQILYEGKSLLSFKLQIAGFVAFFVLAILAPLVMFTPQMARAKRNGLADYGLLAQRYVESFEQKWVRSEPTPTDELLGASDIQSLADLGNSYAVIREMRFVPFGLEDISRLTAATVAPLLPLLLTIFSPEELLIRIIKVLF